MNKKAIILDLDNTIYPVTSIGEELFKPLFQLIQDSGAFKGDMKDIKRDVMRKPFQKVADEYQFSKDLIQQGIEILKDLSYEKPITPFEDYKQLAKIACKKFLVTTGFKKMQQSKVNQMRLDKDFDEIYIVDPMTTDLTKKDIFEKIVKDNGFDRKEVLVVGDDPQSEIQAAIDLGLDHVLYNKIGIDHKRDDLRIITDYSQLNQMLA